MGANWSWGFLKVNKSPKHIPLPNPVLSSQEKLQWIMRQKAWPHLVTPGYVWELGNSLCATELWFFQLSIRENGTCSHRAKRSKGMHFVNSNVLYKHNNISSLFLLLGAFWGKDSNNCIFPWISWTFFNSMNSTFQQWGWKCSLFLSTELVLDPCIWNSATTHCQFLNIFLPDSVSQGCNREEDFLIEVRLICFILIVY